jgi:AraC-like DNA-binding protein
LNFEIEPEWQERFQVTPSELGRNRFLEPAAIGVKVLACLSEPIPAEDILSDLHELLLNALFPADAASPSRPRWLDAAEEFIANRYHLGVQLSDVAKYVEKHPVYVARSFRRAHGRSIADYVRRLKVLRAMRSILDDGVSVGQAAAEAGFADQSHLIRQCKREVGVAPTKMIERLRFQSF